MNYRISLRLLVLVGIVFSLVSCSDNPALRLRYEAEKMLFNAEKTAAEAKQLDKEMLSGVYPAFHNCIEFCYDALNTVDGATYPVEHKELKYLTFKSSLRLAELFFSVRQFDSSIAVLNRLIDSIALSDKQLLQACLNLGQSLQASGRWDSALVVFNFTIEEFYPPVDNLGELVMPAFNLPGSVYRVFNLIGDSAGAKAAFERAESYYRRVIRDFPDTKLEAAAHLALADLYDSVRRWQDELRELRFLSDSLLPNYRDILLRMADVHGGGLKDYDTALALYNYLLNDLGENDTTSMGPEILFRISQVKMEQKDYGEARSVVSRLKKAYPKYYDTIPMPQYVLARSLELDGKWERAEAEYSLLIEKYRGTDEAMMALLYMIDYLQRKGRIEEARTWRRKAEQYYDELAARGRGEVTEARALFYKAELYRRSRDYEAAARILLDVFNKFPDSEPGRNALRAAEKLYRQQLKDADVADSLLNLMKKHASTIPEGG